MDRRPNISSKSISRGKGVSTGDNKTNDEAHLAEVADVEIAQENEAAAAQPETTAEDVEAMREALADAKDQVLRVQAEMQNLRRRVDRDVEKAHKYALEKFLGELLPVVDNLERAIAAININDATQQAIAEGVELTLKSFIDVLQRHNVEQLNPADQTFDPEFHQAMAMVPHADIAANTVIEVFQKGYLLNGRLVRPAMVVVSKGAENSDAEG